MKSSSNHFSSTDGSSRMSCKGLINRPFYYWSKAEPSKICSYGEFCDKKMPEVTEIEDASAFNRHFLLVMNTDSGFQAAQLLPQSEQMNQNPLYVEEPCHPDAVRHMDRYRDRREKDNSYVPCSCHSSCSCCCLRSGSDCSKPNHHLENNDENNYNQSRQSRNMAKLRLINAHNCPKQRDLLKLTAGSSLSELFRSPPLSPPPHTSHILRWLSKGKPEVGMQLLPLFTCLLMALTIIVMLGGTEASSRGEIPSNQMSSETSRRHHIVQFVTSNSTTNTVRTSLASLPETRRSVPSILAKTTISVHHPSPTSSSAAAAPSVSPLFHRTSSTGSMSLLSLGVVANNTANSTTAASTFKFYRPLLEADRRSNVQRSRRESQHEEDMSINWQLLQAKDLVAAFNGVGFGGLDNDDVSANGGRLPSYQNNAIECPSFSENSACPCYKFEDGKYAVYGKRYRQIFAQFCSMTGILDRSSLLLIGGGRINGSFLRYNFNTLIFSGFFSSHHSIYCIESNCL